MTSQQFIELVIKQDKRNKFSKGESAERLPMELIEFYSLHNPVDVEIVLKDLTAIRFYSFDELDKINKEYRLDKGFVFATYEGEPIYILNGEIKSISFGDKKNMHHDWAEDFHSFLQWIVENMKF